MGFSVNWGKKIFLEKWVSANLNVVVLQLWLMGFGKFGVFFFEFHEFC